MNLFLNIILIILGLASGGMVAAGIFAFISAIGIVPRMAKRTQTQKYIPFYEDMITLGGIFGTTTMFIRYHLPIGNVLVVILAFTNGIFVGCLAIALAEVLNVIPIFLRRSRIVRGIPIFICAIAFGKMLGSLLYFIIDGFFIMN
ncbi:stage V sporulation protein AB [Lachnospiraceae bacterium 46-61]